MERDFDDFPPDFPEERMTHSDTADRIGLDNSIPQDLRPNLLKTAWFLQTLQDKLREHFDSDLVVIRLNSGYRNKVLNALVKGSKTSRHMIGLAADIKCSRMTAYELAVFISKNMVEVGYDKIILEYNRWVHISTTQGEPQYLEVTATKKAGKKVYIQGLQAA